MQTSPLNSIDWDSIWQEQMELTSFKGEGVDFWNKMASRIDHDFTDDRYVQEMMQRMMLSPEYSVLDVGCGTGALALPLARLVRRVTALDLSPVMLQRLNGNAALESINDIKTVNADFLEVEGDSFGQHDIVIASRSLPMGNLRRSLTKMHELARHYCYLTWIAGIRETDAMICELLGREYHPYPDYIIIANMLLTMRIYANIELFKVTDRRLYENLDEAAGHLLRDDSVTTEMRENVKTLLEEILTPQDDGYLHETSTQWALIWWNKD